MSTIKHRLIFFPTSSFTATWNLHCNPIHVIKFSGKFNFFFQWKKITIAFKVVYYINKICIVQMETWDSKHNINQISELLVRNVGLKPAITETPCLDRVGHQRTPEKNNRHMKMYIYSIKTYEDKYHCIFSRYIFEIK